MKLITATMRLRHDLKARLEALSALQGRSLSSYLERLVEAHLDSVPVSDAEKKMHGIASVRRRSANRDKPSAVSG